MSCRRAAGSWAAPWLVGVLAAACTGFRAVGDGVFRGPQPGEDQLARQIAAHGIRTVVCLRGPGEGAAATARAAQGAGIRFWQIPMSAMHLPAPEVLLEIWRAAATAERPLLLHCRSGIDRTGLAGAIVALHDTGDLDVARSQLAMLPHGHLGLFRAGAMDEVLDRFAPYAVQMAFPDWVREVYAPAVATGRSGPPAGR